MLLENMEGSDVVFDVAGEKFHAHKLVLAARSPVFRNDFFDKLEEETQEIVITDLDPKVFKVKTSLIIVFFLFYFGFHMCAYLAEYYMSTLDKGR